jgi:phytoene dehydrogenase-like protein
MEQETYDVVVIGAGLGGLLAAAQFLGRGKRVAVVERLSHVGGRFTAKTFQGAQISTGAVHMLPFGTNGIVAAMLRELRVPHGVHDAEVFGSFYVNGQQIHARSMLALRRCFGPRQYMTFLQLGAAMLLRAPRPEETRLTFAEWLSNRRITRATHRELVLFFARICHFALSVDLDQISYPEVCETLKNMLRYGPPGIVEGGCAAVASALERRVCEAGGTVLLNQDARQIVIENDSVRGVIISDKGTGTTTLLETPLIISDIGPQATKSLLDMTPVNDMSSSAATGLKVHVLSDRSFVPHKGILYCLDTERIAGIVQPSNSDPRLAPAGKHLLITHQLWRPERESIAEARAAAMRDLELLLGPQDRGGWNILTMSQYHDVWPVNRAIQGTDAIPEPGVRGLYFVGDAVKPSGYLMAEGVAQSVNVLLDHVDPALSASLPHIAAKPPRRRALTWLVAPPAPEPGSKAEDAPLTLCR